MVLSLFIFQFKVPKKLIGLIVHTIVIPSAIFLIIIEHYVEYLTFI